MQIKTPAPSSNTASNWSEYLQAEIAENHDNVKRKEMSSEVVDYYNNHQLKYLENELRKIYTDPRSCDKKRKTTQNITKMIIDALASCYSANIRRSVSESEDDDQELMDKKLFVGLNKVMSNANKWLLLEQTSLVMAKWSEKKKRVVYQNFHQFEFDLVFDPNSAEKDLVAVILSDYNAFAEANFYVYTNTINYHFVGAELMSENVHNLGILPFVALFARDPGFEDYLIPNIELTRANLELNLAYSNLLNMVQNQAHGVWVMKDPDADFTGISDADPNDTYYNRQETDKRVDIHDPAQMLVLYNVDAELANIKQEADFEGAQGVVQFIQNALCDSMGVDHGAITIDVSKTATQVYLNEKKKEKMLVDTRTVFSDAEKELFEIASGLAYRALSSFPQTDIEDFIIEFQPESLSFEQLAFKDVMSAYESKVIDKIEVIRKMYPTLNRAEAEKFAEEMGVLEEEDEEEEIVEPVVQPFVNVDEEEGADVPSDNDTVNYRETEN